MLERTLGVSPQAIVGFGDDISAISLPGGKAAILKTDMLVGSTDVPPGMTMRQAARKAVVASVSDMAAKGVRPIAGLVALGLPPRLTRKDVHDLAIGLRDAQDEYGFAIVGGDTNESRDLTISIALFAIADPGQLVLRTGARSGDIVAVTGEFGDTSAGLKALLEKRKGPRDLAKPLYDAVFYPRAQLSLGLKLANSRTLSASIDSSDGLAWSLHELAKANGLGIEINTIPVSKSAHDFAQRYRYGPEKLALYGGEEYHLIVAVKRHKLELACRAARGKLKPIGVVTKEFDGVRLIRSGQTVNIPRKGWEHFKTR